MRAVTFPVPLLYLDLDGTVRQGKDDDLGKFVNGPEDVRVFPEAVERMRAWKRGGGRIVAITNQGGLALGYVSPEAVHAANFETNRQAGGLFDLLLVCGHHPDAEDITMTRCWCRKPRIGLVARATFELEILHPGEGYPPRLAYLVGDREEDRLCAEAANIDFLWAADWRQGAGY